MLLFLNEIQQMQRRYNAKKTYNCPYVDTSSVEDESQFNYLLVLSEMGKYDFVYHQKKSLNSLQTWNPLNALPKSFNYELFFLVNCLIVDRLDYGKNPHNEYHPVHNDREWIVRLSNFITSKTKTSPLCSDRNVLRTWNSEARDTFLRRFVLSICNVR